MAEFKLGRIRFVWKGDWTPSTLYYKDDIIRNGGNTYVCIKGHSSPALFTSDQNEYWNKISDGTEWKGDWTLTTYYKVNDIVKYGGNLYICNTAHTSSNNIEDGLEVDAGSDSTVSKWDLFAEGFDYKADWLPNTKYKVNDIVKYNGTVYICTEQHVSGSIASGIEEDLVLNAEGETIAGSRWDIFSEGFFWRDNWEPSTRYKKNDVVRYGGTIYVANVGHNSAADEATGLEADLVTDSSGTLLAGSKWDYLHRGIEFRGNWSSSTVKYRRNDVVKYGGGIWICVTPHNPQATFTADESKWNQFVEGLEFEDSWNATTSYQPGDFVTYGGYSYVSKTNHIGSKPSESTTNWSLFTTGFNWRGDYDDDQDSTATDYRVGDVVRLGGYTYLCIEDHLYDDEIALDAGYTGYRPSSFENTDYWVRLNSGIEWKDAWANGSYYDEGDAVSYGVNSYICVKPHTSDQVVDQNRPDQDVTGEFWNILSGGPEAGNLTTEGDLVYYGGAGPTRLPIGQPGQALRVNNAGNAPEWAYLGAINNVYYVAETGIDEPAPSYGITLDRPFRTVRFAAEQVEKGASNPASTRLLELNKAFIQAEIVEWVDYQITNDIAPFTSSFTYDKEICRRDMGILIDAIIHDLRKGGNVKSRAAALAYFDGATSYIDGQEGETVAAINYGIEVIDAVITNFDPAQNYQTLNGVGSPVTQFKDVTLVEETGAQATIESLLGIVTAAITAGDTTGVPRELKTNSTIFVKTGRYLEVLPIVVPENTAIVGDELRSTRIEPAGSLVDSGDTTYSLDALTRLKAIISDVVSDPGSITKTTGNALDPNEDHPVGSVGSTTAVARVKVNADEIIDILENGVGNADALVFTDTGVAAKTTARTELQTNRATIISDLITWIGSNYPSLVYDQTKCERDTGYIIDGLSYDIQYGGNWATTIMARAYYEGAVAVLPAGQVAETAAAFTQLKTIVTNYMSGATEEAQAGALLDEIIDVISNGIGSLATITYPVVTWASAELQASHAALLAARTEIQSDAVQYVKANNSGLLFNETTCSRDSGYIVDALAYDMAFGSNVQSVFAGISYYRATDSAEVVITDQLDATVGAVRFIKHKSKFIAAAGAGARAEEIVQDIYDYIDFAVNATGVAPAMAGTNTPDTATGFTYAAELLEANREFIVAEIHAYIADAYSGYTYDIAACSRDVNRYIDAIKNDLIYAGNYKSLRAAEIYSNAVNGSLEQDMFYMRNGTGLRNCTVQGLTGELGSPNSFGTSRPSAGAFVSLDPGWGPNHTDAWIINKSPYVQNVTTFGTGCIGLKVDGALHNSGNDSIVANDFTQILSDGIGYWVTNLGRSELVSVFTYYNHIGYLAENGGKIRATNGNNSYGDFGSVAEGVDATEVPIVGVVDNRAFDAVVYNVLTNGNEILAFEYLNAGQGYTTSTTAIKTLANVGPIDPSRTTGTYNNVVGTSSGSGTGQEFSVNVTDTGVVELIITKGGTGHAPGDVITIPASAIGGTGSNVTADVDTVGNATEWTVTGEGFNAAISATNVVDGGVYEVRLLETDVDEDGEPDFGGAGYLDAGNVAQGGTSTSITISNTDTRIGSQYAGMAVFIISGKGAGQYARINSYNSGTKIASVIKFSDGTAGWDHVVPGTAIEPLLDDTTNYSIEPAVIFSAPPSGLYSETAKGRAYVEDGKIVRVTIFDPGVGYTSAPTMTIVDPNNTIDVPHTVRIADGVLTQPSWSNRGVAMATASAEVTGDGFMDRYQNGVYIKVKDLDAVPIPGSNVEFAGLPGQYFKLVSVTQLTGLGPYTARLQVSPEMSITDAPEHLEAFELRIRYSQVRLTGHDFLDIGTGNFSETNYPGIPTQLPNPNRETNNFGGGRVFYTSTDQDGNFRVGELFSVEQSTGIATLNADAFNISGLQELQLGNLELGGTGAVINEFSTDGTFTANSDNIVPTQKAIRTYIQSQIGGGAGELNVNSITAGVIQISTNEITTITGVPINALQKINFQKGIDGHPLAMNFYLNQ